VGVPNVAVAPRRFDEMDTFAPEAWSRAVTESSLSDVLGVSPAVEEQITSGTRFANREEQEA